jgi:hypothetical protein
MTRLLMRCGHGPAHVVIDGMPNVEFGGAGVFRFQKTRGSTNESAENAIEVALEAGPCSGPVNAA